MSAVGVTGIRRGLENPALDRQVKNDIDEVRIRTRFARDVIAAMGEENLAAKVVEHEEGAYGGHPFTQARVAIVEAIAIVGQREELADIVGPVALASRCPSSTQPSGVRPPRCGMTATSPRRSRLLPSPSKGYCKRNPVPACRARTSAASLQRTSRRKTPRAFNFAASTATPTQRRGNQLTKALPRWSAGLAWASATSCPIQDGPSRALMRSLRCSPY